MKLRFWRRQRPITIPVPSGYRDGDLLILLIETAQGETEVINLGVRDNLREETT